MSSEENSRDRERNVTNKLLMTIIVFPCVVVLGLVGWSIWEVKHTPPMTCEDYGSYRIANVPARCLRYWTVGEGRDAGADSGENHD